MSHYQAGGFNMLPPIVKNLLIINGIMFLATIVLKANFHINLNDVLGLHWVQSQDFEWYQIITYMFMHGSFGHIFFNMFAVWMFGNAIENTWGSKRFLTYYVITGIGAAVLHYFIMYAVDIAPTIKLIDTFLKDPGQSTLKALIAEHQFQFNSNFHPEMDRLFQQSEPALNAVIQGSTSKEQLEQAYTFVADYRRHFLNLPVVVGASGSLFGLLLAFGMMFPNTRLFLIFLPIPIKAKYFVIGYGVLELFSGLRNNPGDNVAHFAHLGGMLFGFLLIMYWRKFAKDDDSFYKQY